MAPLINQKGMALLLVLIVVALLSALLTEFSFSTLVDLRATETFRDRTKAFYLARGGVEAARMILQEDRNDFDHPSEFWGDLPIVPVGEGEVSLQVTDLTGRLNLNRIADNKGNKLPSYGRFVALAKEVLNISEAEAEELADAIVNWLNADFTKVTGDDPYYTQQQPPYRRKGAELETLEELNLVRYFSPETVRRLRPFVQVHGGDQINLNTAPTEVLYAWQFWSPVAPVSLAREDIAALVDYRQGTPFRELNDLNQVPGLANLWAGTWAPGSVGVKGVFFEVSSTGRINQGSRVAQAVVLKNGNKLLSLQVE